MFWQVESQLWHIRGCGGGVVSAIKQPCCWFYWKQTWLKHRVWVKADRLSCVSWCLGAITHAGHFKESGVWVLRLGCFLICCGAKLQRMSHSAMIYFTLHPVQFKATMSKKKETVIKHILLFGMAFPSSSRFSNNLAVRCFFPIRRLKLHLSQPSFFKIIHVWKAVGAPQRVC